MPLLLAPFVRFRPLLRRPHRLVRLGSHLVGRAAVRPAVRALGAVRDRLPAGTAADDGSQTPEEAGSWPADRGRGIQAAAGAPPTRAERARSEADAYLRQRRSALRRELADRR